MNSEETTKPPLRLTDEQRNAIQNALVLEHTQQKTPKDFQPQVGMALPMTMKVDAMPETLGREQPVLKQYGYAKTGKDILVLDPMSKKIIAVLPRKFPVSTDANSKSPADWADAKGRELTGQAPISTGNADHFPEPAGEIPRSQERQRQEHAGEGARERSAVTGRTPSCCDRPA